MMISQHKHDPRYLSALLALVFTLGTLALVALVVSLFIVCLYVLNLALDAVCEVATRIASLYAEGDSLVKLIIWLVLLYGVCRVAPWVVGRFRRALHI